MLKIHDWININNIHKNYLCCNSNAISFLKENQYKISWYMFSQNMNALDFFDGVEENIFNRSYLLKNSLNVIFNLCKKNNWMRNMLKIKKWFGLLLNKYLLKKIKI
jgi:hypothetical protein